MSLGDFGAVLQLDLDYYLGDYSNDAWCVERQMQAGGITAITPFRAGILARMFKNLHKLSGYVELFNAEV
jgi:hypothetical protein